MNVTITMTLPAEALPQLSRLLDRMSAELANTITEATAGVVSSRTRTKTKAPLLHNAPEEVPELPAQAAPEAPKPAPQPVVTITLDEVKSAAADYIEAKGGPKPLREILDSVFDVKKLAEVPTERLDELYQMIRQP